ncbi:glycosyltransferase [Burkholderia pseudomultivorans]|uniref:glycosyltransferase n=1 Tax=Burkholderia pseudomultivorans TaxID=1207504 RepID=UPI00075B1226|nr:glycosyltransferase [Burkholderia pseudomultivorans]
MFESVPTEQIEYSDPWSISFEKRLSMLRTGETRIAYFYDRPDNSTFRYRAFNMVEAINNENAHEVSASWFHVGDLPQMESVIAVSDVLIFCRSKYTPAHAHIVSMARRRGMRIGFDIDDLVFDTQYAHLVLDTLDQDTSNELALNDFFAFMARHGTLLKLCDFAITTNQFLAKKIEEFAPHLSARIVPNFLNRRQQEISEYFFHRKNATGFKSATPFHIGYFSGTPTHRRDFAVVSQTLARLLDRYSELRLTIVGFLEPGPYLQRHADRIDRHSLQDFVNLQRLIASTEINIAPLIDNTFTNCKSELKYFEAAITGTLTVATPTYTFNEAIRDGQNGYLSKSHEWEEKLETAIARLGSPDSYSDIARRAFNECKALYGWDRQADKIRAATLHV